MKRRLLLPQITLLMCAVVVLGLLGTAGYAGPILPVVLQDFEAAPNGAFGTVSNFSDYAQTPTATVAAGAGAAGSKGLLFQFDILTAAQDPNGVGFGALNVNVQSPFDSVSNNDIHSLGRYTLEFDLKILAGTNEGWFGFVELFNTDTGAFIGAPLQLSSMTVGSAAPFLHHSILLSDMAPGFLGDFIPTNDLWSFRLVALGFPPGPPGAVPERVLLDNVTVTVDIPEPSSLLLGLASGALCLVRRRRYQG